MCYPHKTPLQRAARSVRNKRCTAGPAALRRRALQPHWQVQLRCPFPMHATRALPPCSASLRRRRALMLAPHTLRRRSSRSTACRRAPGCWAPGRDAGRPARSLATLPSTDARLLPPPARLAVWAALADAPALARVCRLAAGRVRARRAQRRGACGQHCGGCGGCRCGCGVLHPMLRPAAPPTNVAPLHLHLQGVRVQPLPPAHRGDVAPRRAV